MERINLLLLKDKHELFNVLDCLRKYKITWVCFSYLRFVKYMDDETRALLIYLFDNIEKYSKENKDEPFIIVININEKVRKKIDKYLKMFI